MLYNPDDSEPLDMRQGPGDPDLNWNFVKGSWRRNMDESKYSQNYERIFPPKKNRSCGRTTFRTDGTILVEEK